MLQSASCGVASCSISQYDEQTHIDIIYASCLYENNVVGHSWVELDANHARAEGTFEASPYMVICSVDIDC